MMNFAEKKNLSQPTWRGVNLDVLEGKDYLTEVSLRASFRPFLKELIDAAESAKKNFAIVFMDLDRFKKFNDKYGHLFGDEILKYVGSSLRLSFQEVPCKIFRYGGDEFILVFPDKTAKEAQRMVQLLKYNMQRRPVLFKGRFFKITASYGIANYPSDGTTIDDLVKKSDVGLYFSKRQGRNYVTLAGEVRNRKVLNLAILIFSFVLYTILFLVGRPIIERYLDNAIAVINQINTNIQYKNLDTVTLKDGTVMRGEIAHETYRSLTLNRRTVHGILSMYLAKSEVMDKTYGLKTASRDRYEEYVRENPNPHNE
jgi:diguanylate cyclase (GGDEF)-like protein